MVAVLMAAAPVAGTARMRRLLLPEGKACSMRTALPLAHPKSLRLAQAFHSNRSCA